MGSRRNNPKTTPPAEELTESWRAMRQERAKRRQGRHTTRREKRRGTGTEIPHGGHQSISHAWGRHATPPEENIDLRELAPESAHLSLQGVYGDFPYHNDGSHLDGGNKDDAAWQRRWRRFSA